MSDVVEAMARGMCAADVKCGGDPWGDLLETCIVGASRQWYRLLARAALRAAEASGGLVVGKMPEKAASNHSMGLWGDGYNAALAAVRANAVKVEGL